MIHRTRAALLIGLVSAGWMLTETTATAQMYYPSNYHNNHYSGYGHYWGPYGQSLYGPNRSPNGYYLGNGQFVPFSPGTTTGRTLAPHPTGDIPGPPPDAAEIQLRLPDAFATVYFDDAKTSSAGLYRNYVTPTLSKGKDYEYKVKVVWKVDEEEKTETRTIDVKAGQVVRVDFTTPAKASSTLQGTK